MGLRTNGGRPHISPFRLRSASRKYRDANAIRTRGAAPSGVRGQGLLSVYFKKKKKRQRTQPQKMIEQGVRASWEGRRNVLSGDCQLGHVPSNNRVLRSLI